MMLKLKSYFLPLLSMFLLLIAVSLAGCTSKEQALKEREDTLSKFVTSVSTNVFDRNPATIRESMDQLTRLQLNDKARNKLQADGEIPDTELDVLKIIDDNQNKHISNKVEIESVRAIGPMDKNEVPFKVVGKNTALQNGKPSDSKVFSITVVGLLTPEMGGYPKCTDISGLPGRKTASSNVTKSAVTPAASTKRRRRR
jgi:hypothetical protein